MAEEVLVACRCRHGVRISLHCFMVGTIVRWVSGQLLRGEGTFPLMVGTFYTAPLKSCYTLWLAPFCVPHDFGNQTSCMQVLMVLVVDIRERIFVCQYH